MLATDTIRAAFSEHAATELTPPEVRRAAVAMVLRDGATGPEVLFIQRAVHQADPWSGHMAFPGGRVEADDPTIQHAAERETLEEVGVRLDSLHRVGRLDDLQGRHAGRTNSLVISGFVYHHPDPEELAPNYEVQDTFWFPLAGLLEAERHIEREFRETGSMKFPGIIVGDPDHQVVWGLTYRFIEVFFEVLGHPLPNRWGDDVRPLRAREE